MQRFAEVACAEHLANTISKALPHCLQDDLQSLPEPYAEDGIERLAGKGWRELEKEQQLLADADMGGIACCLQQPQRNCDDQLVDCTCCKSLVCCIHLQRAWPPSMLRRSASLP